MPFFWILIGILFFLQDVKSLYFKQTTYKACHKRSVQLYIDTSGCAPSTLKFSSETGGLTSNSDGLVAVGSTLTGGSAVPVEASCIENGNKVNVTATVVILKDCDTNRLASNNGEHPILCFDGSYTNFYVEENIAPTPLGDLSPFVVDNRYSRTYSIENDNKTRLSIERQHFKINSRSSTLTLSLPLDYETKHQMSFKVRCHLTFRHTSVNTTSQINVNIRDKNDNPPLFQHIGSPIKSVLVTDTTVKEAIVDKDVSNCSQYDIKVFEDPLNVCHPEQLTGYHVPSDKTYCRLAINVSRTKKQLPENYTCNVAVIDGGYMLASNESKSGWAILELKWMTNANNLGNADKNRQIQIRINRNAGRFTRVYTFPKTTTKTIYYMNLPKHAFAITADGTVYIDNVTKLYGTDVVAKVTITAHPNETETELFILFIGTYTGSHTDGACDHSCSRFMTKSHCESGCGLGAPSGKCIWRNGVETGGPVTKYATCSPDIHTCPDQKCDSLEKADLVCPQDCTTKIVGLAQINPATGKGILRATSPCWCDYEGECTCFSSPKFSTTTVKPLSPGTYNSSSKDRNQTVRVDPVLDDKLNSSDHSVCDIDCKITIATICGCISALVCLFVLIWKTRRFKCQRKKTLKHVGSVASMSVIPSDYLDDRDYRTHSSPQYGPYYKESTTGSMPEDAKWEIDRDNLQLDVTLGEGEFGKVVKAKAFNIDGKQTYTDVAVKMLKNCASTVEQQALWSEFNLLKDVQHPNVIRLLGACTQNGPIYLIVEYCEHGSLLFYLRNSRLEENGYVNQRYKPNKPANGSREPPELLTVRDLLSFGWQTAKGMQYLSEIKLVHRDLAARNILVGSGKVLKISDFGLTRDVYEADTYLKQSKGRIPVKWLAPESLYAQIYTTQSDVWSFGIVLWEIVTLGAPPYPGVPPERLYNLLLAGYRMDRPENCSDELYAVMQKCWKTDPQDRPNFAKLADIFDKMLQQKTEYLELTGGFDDDANDLFGNRYAPSVSGISIVGNRPSAIHSEQTQIDNRNNGSSYLTPALTNTVDPCLSDVTSLKREPSDSSEMASLLTERNNKNPFVNETVTSRKAEQTVV